MGPPDATRGSGRAAFSRGPSQAQSEWTFSAESDLDSRFIWRGQALSRGPVLQAAVGTSFQGFSASLFANELLTQENGRNGLSTVVPDISYTIKVGRFTLKPGASYYWSSEEERGGGAFTTVEANALAFVDWGPLRFAAANHIDVKACRGGYFGTLGVESEREIGSWTFTLGGALGAASARFNEFYFGPSVSTLDLVQAEAVARHELNELFFVAMHIEASELVAPSLRAANESFLLNTGFTLGLEM